MSDNFLLTRRDFLVKSDNPSVVNVASIAGVLGIGSSVAYAASKGARLQICDPI